MIAVSGWRVSGEGGTRGGGEGGGEREVLITASKKLKLKSFDILLEVLL